MDLLLTDDELGDIEVSVTYHNWLLSHDLKWTDLIPLWRETCKAQLAKAEPIIRRQEGERIAHQLEPLLLVRPKSMLEDCAYQGPPPKKWVKETGPRYEGYNTALKELQDPLRELYHSLKDGSEQKRPGD